MQAIFPSMQLYRCWISAQATASSSWPSEGLQIRSFNCTRASLSKGATHSHHLYPTIHPPEEPGINGRNSRDPYTVSSNGMWNQKKNRDINWTQRFYSPRKAPPRILRLGSRCRSKSLFSPREVTCSSPPLCMHSMVCMHLRLSPPGTEHSATQQCDWVNDGASQPIISQLLSFVHLFLPFHHLNVSPSVSSKGKNGTVSHHLLRGVARTIAYHRHITLRRGELASQHAESGGCLMTMLAV